MNRPGTMEEKRDVIGYAAELLAAGHDGPAQEMLFQIMWEMSKHPPGAGAGSFKHWVSSLKALSQVCNTLYQLYRTYVDPVHKIR